MSQFEMHYTADQSSMMAVCVERTDIELAGIIENSFRDVPKTDGITVRMLSPYAFVRNILANAIISVTDGRLTTVNQDGDISYHLEFEVALHLFREWILRTGGFSTLPVLDEATLQQLEVFLSPA